MAELRGLGELEAALARKRGRVLAVSVDAPEINKRVVAEQKLAFPILSDERREVIRSYGLVHANAYGKGADIAIPAQVLVRRDGTIAWRHVSKRIQDRADPSETLAAIEKLD